jgi:hypothetical protein
MCAISRSRWSIALKAANRSDPLTLACRRFCRNTILVSVYRVHFKWKEKDLMLRAKGLDLTHPYFVSITEIIFPEGKKLIIDPSEDEVRRTFGRADHLMLPFQIVTLIEEYKDGEPDVAPVVRKFSVVAEEPPGEAEVNDPVDSPGRNES